MKIYALFACIIFSVGANAGVISVEYQFDHPSYTDIAGSFSGTDNNNDGWLTYEELDSWHTHYRFPGDLSDLNDIGDFDYINNFWVPNAKQWDRVTEDSYMTWQNWWHSASTSNAFFSSWGSFITRVTVTPIPEPDALILLGLALSGFIFYRRRPSSSSYHR